MGFEQTVQRIVELQRLTGAAIAPAQTVAAEGSQAFSGMLEAAQQRTVLAGSEDEQRSLSGFGAGASAQPGMSALSAYASQLSGGAGASPMAPGMLQVGNLSLPVLGSTPGTTGVTAPYGTSPIGGIAPGMSIGGTVGQRIVALAQQEVGVAEAPAGSNDSPRIREYRSATAGALETPGPWCAYFVSWLSSQSGAPIGPDGSGYGWVPSVEQWGKDNGRWFASGTAAVQPGDFAIFERNGDGTTDHIGIVEYVEPNGKIHTIEGNSSDKVSRRSYEPGQIHSFVRPG